MRVMLRRSIATLAAVLVSVGLATGVAAAQTQSSGSNVSGNGFRISPVRSEIVVDKGKSTTLTVTIENPTDFQTAAQPIINDFVASDKEDGQPRLILDDKNAPTPKNDFKSLVQPLDVINLGPRQKKDVTVRISVPQGANSGGYYGAIRFIPSAMGSGGNVSLTASVGTIVLITVPGNLTEKLSLVQIGAEQKTKDTYEAKSFMTSGDVSVFTRLKNDGDIHVQPFGRVQVKNMFGKVVQTYEFNNTDPRANILPGSTRRFDDALAKRTWFGRYTVEANLSYSQGSGSIIMAKAVFWYLPVWFLVTLAVVVVALAVGGYLLYRKLTRKGHKKK